jgi:DNA-binding winged helix-turn-helix (wHTH) protein
MRYLFEDFVLDTERRELRRGPDVVPTTPEVLDLLEYLIRSRDRVVDKAPDLTCRFIVALPKHP